MVYYIVLYILFSMLEQSAEDEDIGSVSSITQFVESADLLIQRLLDYRYIYNDMINII